jgi:hypothetical protein
MPPRLSQQMEDLLVATLVPAVNSPGNKNRWNLDGKPPDVIIVIRPDWVGMAFQRAPVSRNQCKQIQHVKRIESGSVAEGANPGKGAIES